ncbi:hypothetical protein ANCDUO_08869 [Ancylostoma duodenale]|uniref:Uncharacterized protein n=1 Tax=Ancylostoma duodenale TaxID=51022 RepID=A0A0C2DEP8_9BILA|nr:hypothetical protein ANCDUO_08869 [Ancylostoma duodenale]
MRRSSTTDVYVFFFQLPSFLGNYDSSFSLPPAHDEQVAFLLTNCGRLSDYKWIGLYDQCKNVSKAKFLQAHAKKTASAQKQKSNIRLLNNVHKKWFQVSIKLVSLEDVDPPREEEIGPMIGQERNISSGPVRILNCNTILVPDLYFEASQNSPSRRYLYGNSYIKNTT